MFAIAHNFFHVDCFVLPFYIYARLSSNTQLHTRLTELLLTRWPLCTAFLYKRTAILKHATSHKADWITTDRFVLPFYVYTAFSLQNVLKVEGSRSRLLKNSIATACIRAFSYLSARFVCCYWIACSMNLLVCICIVCIVYTLPLVALSSSISITLMIFVLIAFLYCS